MNDEELDKLLNRHGQYAFNSGVVGMDFSDGYWAREIKALIKSRDQQIDSERFDYKRLKALEIKSIDDYQKFKAGEPNSPERIAAWIHQLSSWNLERGVEALRERDQQIALAAQERELKEIPHELLHISEVHEYKFQRLATLKQAQGGE